MNLNGSDDCTPNANPRTGQVNDDRPLRLAVINADDFGCSAGVNQAIIQAHTQGILTSTSLMVTAAAAPAAVTLAKAHPTLAVGLHLVLVCGQSALPPAQIPHLVDAQGNFPDDPFIAGLRYQFHHAARQELRQEIRAQLEQFRQTGLPLSHVDGHLHLHCHPVVLGILAELAAEFNITTIRLPSEELRLTLRIDRRNLWNKLLWAGVFGQLRRHGERVLQAGGIRFSDRVYGLLQTGQVTEAYLLQLIPQIQANQIEIYCHPAVRLPDEPLNGPPQAGALELAALLSQSVLQVLQQQGFCLTTFADGERC
jgi:chitin disaccharide deacetylase